MDSGCILVDTATIRRSLWADKARQLIPNSGFPIDEAQRHDLAPQLQSGNLRLGMTCPFPEVVDKVRKATAKTGTPKDPKVALLEVEALPPEQPSSTSHHLANLLDVPKDQLPPVRLKWCHLSLSASGELQARCPKVPSDLEAGVGYHVDNQNPGQKEHVFGYLHLKTTDLFHPFSPCNPVRNRPPQHLQTVGPESGVRKPLPLYRDPS